MWYGIRRPVGRKYQYFGVVGGVHVWGRNPFDPNVAVSGTREKFEELIKLNKGSFGPDDEIFAVESAYNGTFCPYCIKDNTVRVDGTERQSTISATFDMICTCCGAKWSEEYAFSKVRHGET